MNCWLEVAGGARVPIKPAGVLIGRASHCDVVVTDAGASRAQAIVFAGPSGPSLTVLGKSATWVNGEAVNHERELVIGDRIELPGLSARVVEASDGGSAAPPSSWVVRVGGRLFGVVRSPFTVGSSPGADLRVDGPALGFRFHLATRLHVEAVVALAIDGAAVEAGAIESLEPGAVLELAGQRFEIIAGGSLGQDSTAAEPALTGPERVHLEFLARGGRLTVTLRGVTRVVYLPERRCDLIAALLRPPAPFAPGEFVPDDVLLPRIWPGRPMTRVDLNVLLHRARQDLLRAELDGATLLPRADGGVATRFVLGRAAQVTVE